MRSGPKSRGACHACRAKKLKCDETKPGCRRCTLKGQTCPGYQRELKWSTKYEVRRTRTQAPPKAVPTSSLPCATSLEPVEDIQTVMYQGVIEDDEAHAVVPRTVAIGSDNHPLLRPMPPIMMDIGSFLVDQYFSRVCVIFSMYDSSLNPFRTLVKSMVGDSVVIYYTIQSMAAAFLGWDAAAMQTKLLAIQHLQKSLRQYRSMAELSDESTLATFLLGLTACWHDSSDLGLEYLGAAKQAVMARPREQKWNRTRLLTGMMEYWEMLAAVIPGRSQDRALEGLGIFSEPCGQSIPMDSPMKDSFGHFQDYVDLHDDDPGIPHPWIGIAPRIIQLFKAAGELMTRCYDMGTNCAHFDDTQALEQEAQCLEEELLEAELPTLGSIKDPGDEKTPPDHFLVIAEVYRCSALLIIYRMFSSLLRRRLGCAPVNDGQNPHFTPYFSPGALEYYDPFMDFPSPSHGDGFNSGTIEDDEGDEMARSWLVAMALHILTQLDQLPPSSGTKPVQPIILVVASNELSFPKKKKPNGSVQLDIFSCLSPLSPSDFLETESPIGDQQHSKDNECNNDEAHNEEVRHGRAIVLRKLDLLGQALPPKQIGRVQELIKLIWRSLDEGNETHWLKVMVEHKMETIMG